MFLLFLACNSLLRWRAGARCWRSRRRAATASACLRRPLGPQPHALRHARNAGQMCAPSARCSLCNHVAPQLETAATYRGLGVRSCFSFLIVTASCLHSTLILGPRCSSGTWSRSWMHTGGACALLLLCESAYLLSRRAANARQVDVATRVYVSF